MLKEDLIRVDICLLLVQSTSYYGGIESSMNTNILCQNDDILIVIYLRIILDFVFFLCSSLEVASERKATSESKQDDSGWLLP